MSGIIENQKNEIATGGSILEPGTATRYETGSWRTFRPIVDANKCVHCLFCWLYCPDLSVLVDGGKMAGFDYTHCKGCGICAAVCPDRAKAIQMVRNETG